ncbi:hypothetical protein ACWDKQ_35080 [Saccharopolyspora sp. NPDC000995]
MLGLLVGAGSALSLVDGPRMHGELTAPGPGGGVHCSRTGQGPKVAVAKVITIVSVPRWAAGFQVELVWPCEQVGCSRSKSMVKRVRSNPAPALAWGEW